MRLIGIKIIDGDKRILKNLKKNTWYPFGNYIEPKEENDWEWMSKQIKEDEDNLRAIYKSLTNNPDSSLDITVNCIVGKNGSGKSSLLDIFYRIINNFSYQLFDKQWIDNDPENNPQRGHTLKEAKNFDAILFFETDGSVGSIRYSYGHYDYNYYSKIEDSKILNNKIDKRLSKTMLERITRHLFYTICTNYSIHSLNEKDYDPNPLHLTDDPETNGEWLNGLFHKNDGYMVPIVMVPYRNNGGIININNENHLAKLRLATLAVLFASKRQKFLDDYKPVNFLYRFKYDSNKYFNEKFNKLYKDYLPLNKQTPVLKRFLKRRWKQELNEYYSNSYKKLPKIVKDSVLSYLTYKTFKNCLHYRIYGELLGLRKLTKEEEYKVDKSGNDGLFLELKQENIDKIIKSIHFDDSKEHVNYKIQQLLHFVKNLDYNVFNLEIPKDCPYDPTQEVKFGWSSKSISKIIDDNKNRKKIENNFNTYDEVFICLPPAIFDWDLTFTKGNEEEELLSQMSSGEKQFMHSVSYIIYHINNLQSVKESKYKVRYHNLSLIFDEAELYYHPEYQRNFISYIIRILSWSNINKNIIRGVNILIVTHSPFVLSDVPVNHTLFLDYGIVIPKENETFCGNIHELLGNNFFMKYSIGEIAKQNVEEIIKLYKDKDNIDKSEENKLQFKKEYDKFKYVSKIISDDYLRKKISWMLSELLTKFRQEDEEIAINMEINEISNKLEFLKSKLNLLKNKNDKN